MSFSKEMISRERVSIATSLPDADLLMRVQSVFGEAIGTPLASNKDSVRLRERYQLVVEHNAVHTWVFNDQVEVAVRVADETRRQWAARRATAIAVASMYSKE